MNTVSLRWVSRMLTPNCTLVSEELLKRYRRESRDNSKNLFHNSLLRMKRASITSILSQNNKVCYGTNELVKIVISLHCETFFHVICKQPMTAKMHKIFIAQKSYCACHVLSLGNISTNTTLILFSTELQCESKKIPPLKGS